MSPNEPGIPNPKTFDLTESFEEKKIKLLQEFKRPENLEETFCNLYKALRERQLLNVDFFNDEILLNFSGALTVNKIVDNKYPNKSSYWFDHPTDIEKLHFENKKNFLDVDIRIQIENNIQNKSGGVLSLRDVAIDDILKHMNNNYTDITNQISWTAGRIIIKPTHSLGNKWFKSEINTEQSKGEMIFQIDYDGKCESVSFKLEGKY